MKSQRHGVTRGKLGRGDSVVRCITCPGEKWNRRVEADISVASQPEVHGLPRVFGRLRVALILACVMCHATFAADANRPNVLFIISDDLNNMLGCYGDSLAKTPHIDRLASRGVRFDRAYCAFPLCGPSRNALLTGLYPNNNDIFANQQIFRQTIPQQQSMPQAFRNAGYFAARIGKLFHYNVPKSVGTNGHDDPGSWE